jgi:hypothetical protein
VAEHGLTRDSAGEARAAAGESRGPVPDSRPAELQEAVGQAGPHYVAGLRPATQRSCQTLTL